VPHFDEQLGAVMGGQMTPARDLLLGRRTYGIFAAYWPQNESDWPGVNAVTKYVVSNTRTESLWENTVFLKGNVAEEVKRLKQQDGSDLQVHGSSGLLQTLFQHDLVDELWIKIFPITLGAGKRLFGAGAIPAAFRLTHSEVTPAGVIVANYERAGDVQTGLVGS
jgi:dihydrofolate reductase